MSKSSFNVLGTPLNSKLQLPDGVKSVQIRNTHYINTLWVADRPGGLLTQGDRHEIPPRSDMVIEIDPAKKTAILYACHDNRNLIGPAVAITIETTPFFFYGVRGMLQGDLNPTRTWQDYTEYTAVNDNENVAYNVAVQLAALGTNRVRDVLIKAETNGVLIGLDNQHALARGPPVVATHHLSQGEVLELEDVSLWLEITAMNDTALANCEIWIFVQGD